MNFFEVRMFYGIGFGIEAVNDHFGYIDTEEEDEVPSLLNGIMIDFLCFRMVIGRTKPCPSD
jgi:hypothetical protein